MGGFLSFLFGNLNLCRGMVFAAVVLFCGNKVLFGEEGQVQTEKPANLDTDPFYQSFNEAFNNVLAESAPDIHLSEKKDSSGILVNSVLEVFDAEKKNLFTEALLAAVPCEHLAGAKARRSFIFAKGEDGYSCLETGGVFDMTPGEILRTGRSLDIAIAGEGFFQLKRERDGVLFFSRAGNFSVNREGFLYLENGGDIYLLEPSVKSPEQIKVLYKFPNPSYLSSADSLFFQPTEMSGGALVCAENEISNILYEHLEASNSHSQLILEELKKLREREVFIREPLAEIRKKE